MGLKKIVCPGDYGFLGGEENKVAKNSYGPKGRASRSIQVGRH